VDQTGPKERGDLRVYVNPEIVERSEETVESEEGCLSCPELSVKVDRHERVKVKALDREGNQVCVDAEGFLSIVLQHEIDHLEGVTLADRLGRLKKGLYKKRAMKWK
jgi:peptide deformylase